MIPQPANMKLTIIYGIFGFVFPTIAAAATTELMTCNVTKQPDGYMYRLSQAPNLSKSSWCQTSWEHHNKTVIVRTHLGGDPVFDINLVQNRTDQSVTLKNCYDYLRFTTDCGTWDEAVCRVNCSAVLGLKDRLPPTVNDTLICFNENWCLSHLAFGLCLAGFLLLGAAVLGVLYFRKTGKCRRRESVRVSYTPAKNHV